MHTGSVVSVGLKRQDSLEDPACASAVVPLHASPWTILLSSGRSPRRPNEVVLWDDALGRSAAELKFRENICGLACRRAWLTVPLRRRIVIFRNEVAIEYLGKWDTLGHQRFRF